MTTNTTELRALVEQAWRTALGGTRSYFDGDNFLQLGGHSLLALHVADELEAKLGRSVPVRTVLSHPVFGELLAALELP